MDVIRDELIVKSDGLEVLGMVTLVIVDVVSVRSGCVCGVGGWDWRRESSASRSIPWVARKAWAMVVLGRCCWWSLGIVSLLDRWFGSTFSQWFGEC